MENCRARDSHWRRAITEHKHCVQREHPVSTEKTESGNSTGTLMLITFGDHQLRLYSAFVERRGWSLAQDTSASTSVHLTPSWSTSRHQRSYFTAQQMLLSLIITNRKSCFQRNSSLCRFILSRFLLTPCHKVKGTLVLFTRTITKSKVSCTLLRRVPSDSPTPNRS